MADSISSSGRLPGSLFIGAALLTAALILAVYYGGLAISARPLIGWNTEAVAERDATLRKLGVSPGHDEGLPGDGENIDSNLARLLVEHSPRGDAARAEFEASRRRLVDLSEKYGNPAPTWDQDGMGHHKGLYAATFKFPREMRSLTQFWPGAVQVLVLFLAGALTVVRSFRPRRT